ncbi:MAG: ABC transporter substrate-binding protein [Proteobacteria bacterium]|nr:ABC transporter substrate-binding protein [Pseudomonadota bacterium]
MKGRKRWGGAGILLAVIILAAGPTAYAAENSKPDYINLAIIADLSGPYAPMMKQLYVGAIDASDYINSELGGVKGVPVKMLTRDSGNKVDVAVSHYMELREMKPKPYFIYMAVSAESEALRERFTEDRLPCMSVSALTAIYPAAYTFGSIPLYVDHFGAFIDWLAETWKKPARPKLAFLTWDSTYGRAVLTDECRAYAKEKGVEIVAEELFGLRDVDVTTQLTRIRAKGADWVYTNTAAHGPIIIAKGLKEMGYEAKLANGSGFDIATLRINPKLLAGHISIMPFADIADPDNKPAKKIYEYFNKNKRQPQDMSGNYLAAWCYALTAVEAIGRAVDQAGWDKLDGQAVKEQMVRMKKFGPLGGLVYYTFSEKKRTPSTVRVYRAESNGQFTPLTGWREAPDLRPAKYK